MRGPLNCIPSPQRHPVLIQAGASPRGIRASAYIADHIFARWPTKEGKAKHRAELDKALVANGRDPEKVGVLWGVGLIVGETEQEAKDRREQLLTMIPPEAVGPYLSHNAGYDFSTLPERFSPAELNAKITAKNASPVGFVFKLANMVGEKGEISRKEFFEFGLAHRDQLRPDLCGHRRAACRHARGRVRGRRQPRRIHGRASAGRAA